MNSENRLWKWLLIVGLTAMAILVLYPPSERLKPGIDLAGGTSLIYEIDTTGMTSAEQQNLSERVMSILKARVDPNSQFNIVWRPIGNNRLEIQLPRPPKEAQARRQAYDNTRDALSALNVSRLEIEQALALPADQREAAIDALVRGVEGRRERLEAAQVAWDAYLKARDSGDFEAEVNAQENYEKKLEQVLATNLTLGRLGDVLPMKGDQRAQEVERLKSEHPSYADKIDAVVASYDMWSAKRGSLEDPADLKRLLRGAGVLEFRILAERDASNPTVLKSDDPTLRQPVDTYVEQLMKRGPRPKARDRYIWFPVEDFVKFMQSDDLKEAEQRQESGKVVVEKYAGRYYVLAHADEGQSKYGLTRKSPPWSLRSAMASRDPSTGKPSVLFTLDPRGGRQFGEITRTNIGQELAIFLDGTATSHATIQSQINERGTITGNFTEDRVNEIVRKLEAGSLPARLKETPLLEKNVGPALGERNREMGMQGAIYGFVAVVVFMLGYYLFAGVLADIALMLNLLFVLAIMAMLEATFTLPGIAGLLLTVGMAVDANVLIYERIREERDRGVSLKKAVKAGYEKAFSTIVDANLTTLITCIILGYVGSEEVKGFAMTLGFGIVTSMFTALFVTRVILNALMNRGIVKSLPMLRLIGRPNIDWIKLRKFFWPVSSALVIGGLGFFVYLGATNKEEVYDIEFLGGTSVQIELAKGVEMTAPQVRQIITANGAPKGELTAIEWLKNAADAMRAANVQPAPGGGGRFVMTSDKLSATEMNVLLRTTFEDALALGGFSGTGNEATFETKPIIMNSAGDKEGREAIVDLATFKKGVDEAADYVEAAATRLAGARVQTVSEIGAQHGGTEAPAFEVITVEPNKELVRAAILGVMGNELQVDRPIEFTVVKDPQRAPDGLFPIKQEAEYLGDVIGTKAPTDIRAYKGGVALVFDKLTPPQSIEAVNRRFKEMRLQPQFEQSESRDFTVIGLQEAGQDAGGNPQYSKIALVVSDESLIYDDDPVQWEERLAKPEMDEAIQALSAEKSLRKVVQFAPQIASQTQQRALIAIMLALAAIVAYVWFRFGTMEYGLAGIVALVHDVGMTLGAITVADWLGVGNFRIDLPMVAALLTIIGYSLNDTIVVFDRIRETRGKLKTLTPSIVNSSINMTLSRTLLTSLTTLIAVAFLYFLGGPGVHGFSFALLFGIIVGTYSSIGIASPLVLYPRMLYTVVFVLIGLLVLALTLTVTTNLTTVAVVGVIMAILVALAIAAQQRMYAGSRAPRPA